MQATTATFHLEKLVGRTTNRGLPRLLVLTALFTAAMSVAFTLAVIVDDSVILGVSAWIKPLKFSVSISVYTFSLAVIIAFIPRARRSLVALGNTAAIALIVELGIIVSASLAGTTSHFNVGTPLTSILWVIMGATVVCVWVATLGILLITFFAPVSDPSRALALRGGLIVAFIGMAIGFLMLAPTSQQLADYQGVIGAHTVGLPDGGPGLPVLGWSTVGGDLRISHFIGMHAMQVLPLTVLALESAASATPMLRNRDNRLFATRGVLVMYIGLTLITMWQALRGQPITQPDTATVLAATGLFSGTIVTVAVLVFSRARRWSESCTTTEVG